MRGIIFWKILYILSIVPLADIHRCLKSCYDAREGANKSLI
nr:MAG TPA: hypothetical protein [Caudoviricetes sp.]